MFEPPGKHEAGHLVRRADINIFAVKFKTLVESTSIHTGDAVLCNNPHCTAVLSHLSNVTKVPGREEKVCEQAILV